MKQWISVIKPEKTLRLLEKISTMLANRNAGNEFFDELIALVRARNFAEILRIKVDYDNWVYPVEALRDYRQILSLYQKLDCIELEGIDKEQVAFTKWLKAEEICDSTNRFLLDTGFGVNLLPKYARVFYAAQKKIRYILGPCPSVADLDLKFGPGATTSVAKKSASAQCKLADTPTCSENLLRSAFFAPLVRELPHWLSCHEEVVPELVDGFEVARLTVTVEPSKLVFVPKTALTDRSIMIQPNLDTLLQMGIGTWIAKRLLKAGIDISDQGRNQRLARLGSLTRDPHGFGGDYTEIATLDLSSASDTISYQLVKFLLPEDWFRLLTSCRPSETTYNGKIYRLAQFSAMGNGYTFPLETLIFYALTVATLAHDGISHLVSSCTSVYGDDIILPACAFDSVCETLNAAGFVCNTDKSFSRGPFRESCGADYYRGIDIRPYYQKTGISAETLTTFHNHAKENYDDELVKLLASMIPERFRLYGPSGYGDGHLHESSGASAYRTRKIRREGWEGFYFKTHRHIGCKMRSLYPGDWVTPLYMIYTRGPSHSQAVIHSDNGYDYPDVLLYSKGPSYYASYGVDRPRVSVPVKDTKLEFVVSGDYRRAVYDLPGTNGVEVVSIYTLSL